ncbi:MFS transporter, DHA1 family, chloramphenicol resistance protein [Amycolatopsis tolypomycina]|uniref:MFS transporter, DHA1 family, chloramphenicol resistance protein n=2 Tax=Amycolatopsis tolypomycina TaxID=208445 RepID=A0A1H4IE03_9PSEU|nr:Cmx/CmrA family chloramphenicol efflux MFS transporter [Amycolatopsis tolypomycina]SEB31926.1 MFS transporter, DHA1 family, chloramphenicol resistance protein [Amycolatopsis tolypomycina]
MSLYFLALGVFAMGTSEFMLAGLVPGVAAALDVSVAQAGYLTSAFAAGMVAGAPLMAALARRWRRRTALRAFLALFVAAHVAGGLTTSFGVLLGTRVAAALANAGFLAVALTAAAGLVPPEKTGRALAVLLGGTTLACVAGIPGGALLDAAFGWRSALWVVAALCLPALAGVSRVADTPAGGTADLRSELRELRRLPAVLVLGALVNAATFGVFTFLAPIADGVAPVPVVLAAFGIGCFAGVTVAGRLADRWPGRVISLGGALLLAGWVALALTTDALVVLAFTQGALSFAVGGTVITRILREATGAPTMAGSYATAALNVGATAGPVLAGLADPFRVAAALVAAALAVHALRRRT